MVAALLVSHEGRYGFEQAVAELRNGSYAIDAIEAGIHPVEDDVRARTVGYGGAPNAAGRVEFDASIMDGTTFRTGAVGALHGFRHPISVARKVMEVLPHVFLVGAGADRFAAEMQAERADMLAEESKREYDAWLKQVGRTQSQLEMSGTPIVDLLSWEVRTDLSKGTVTFLALDNSGNLCGGVSTSGWAYKYPGRLGDSPVIGAGMYVDSRYGGAACTHTGEMTLRAGTARAVVAYLKRGASIKEACEEALDDLSRLQGGYLGPVIVHAMDAKGTPYVARIGEDDGDHYQYWNSESDRMEDLRVLEGSSKLAMARGREVKT